MKNWKQWLIISTVVSVICTVAAGIIWGSRLFICDPDCWLDTTTLGTWWIIPVAALVGFILPVVSYGFYLAYRTVEENIP
ncbi:MAG: hypothetical protein ACFFCM_19030 [Promethearchaeota archaeon]